MFKDRLKVKLLLKEGAHRLEKEQKVLFEENFQKKVNKTIKSKKKTKEPLKEYTKATSVKRAYHYGTRWPPFRKGPHPSSLRWRHQPYQNQGFVPRYDPIKFCHKGGRGKLESQPQWDTSIQHKSDTSITHCKNNF